MTTFVDEVRARGGRRTRLAVLLGLGAGLALLGPALAAPAGAAARPATDSARGRIVYERPEALCPAPKRGHVSCDAVKMVRARKGSVGARPFLVGADSTTIGPAGGLTPADLASAYDFSPTSGGTTQTVAIVDWGNDPTLASNLDTFDKEYGLSSCTTSSCLSILNSSGQTSPLPSDQGAADEIALDVETVHSVCENCKIDLIEAASNSFASTEAAENEAATIGATEISNSYGGTDTSGPSAAMQSAYNHPGIVITVSVGDDGYYSWDRWVDTPSGGPPANPSATNQPGDLATVVAVGGTSLDLAQNGSLQSASVWNENGVQAFWEQQVGESLGATGGGCSLFVTAPAWQQALSDWSQTACGDKRLDSDISAVADPYTGFDTYNTSDGGTGWETIGGTSLSAPLIAGMFALAGGSHGVAYPALTLYGHLGSKSIYDVASGGNGFCDGEGAPQCGDANDLEYNDADLGALDCDYNAAGTAPAAGDLACDAGAGYDGPSGVGSPIGLGAFAKTGPSGTISGKSTITHGTNGTWTISVKDPFPGGKVTSYKWVWGDGKSSTTTTGSAKHKYSSAATRTITVTMTDNYAMTGTATFSVKVT